MPSSKRRLGTWVLACFVPSVTGCMYAIDPSAAQDSSSAVMITDVGMIGTADDSAVFQAAADRAEASGGPLVLPAGSTINLRGNVYLGNLTLVAAGSTINCLFDEGFKFRGKASLRGNGCILTKSAEGADYGRRTVSIKFDTLTVNTFRTQGNSDAQIGLLLENTSALVGQTLAGTATGVGQGEVTPFDFRSGVQGVRIGRVEGHMRNGAGAGGFWIRNTSPARSTSNISIGTIEMDGATGDELLAIFNARNPAADLHDIHIGRLILHADGGCGQGVSIFRNAGPYNPRQMQRISIDQIDVDVARIGPRLSKAPGVFAVKVNAVDATVGTVSIRYSGIWAPDTPHVYALRFVPGPGQTTPLHIATATMSVDARNATPRGDATLISGPVVIDNLVVRGEGSGFRNIAVGANRLGMVDARIGAVLATPFADSGRVKGVLNGRTIDQ